MKIHFFFLQKSQQEEDRKTEHTWDSKDIHIQLIALQQEETSPQHNPLIGFSLTRKEELDGNFTGCRGGGHGGSGEVTAPGDLTLALEVAVDSVVAVALDGVGLVASSVLEDGAAVSSGSAGII